MTETPTYDVLGIGVIAVDDLLYVEAYPPAEAKVRVLRRERQCGGQTGTALVAARRLGARCAYLGTLGPDELSRTVMDQFHREGIDTAHAVLRDDARPYHSTIVVDQGSKTRTIFSSSEGFCGADPTNPPADVIRSGSVLLIDHHQLEGTLRAVRIAREAGRSIVADFERVPEGPFDELLALVDHLVLPKAFAMELTSAPGPAEAVAALKSPGRTAVVVTCGREGLWYAPGSGDDQPQHFPAFPVEVVDTTGCGDVFHGAYAAAVSKGLNLAQCVGLGAASAALKATQPGGQAGIPTLQMVETWLAQFR
ncbi:MAG: hypothetical protein JW818_01205 [Pirellulales bacterium]|nr:hypothetical protein [Pirellulales bacterium]